MCLLSRQFNPFSYFILFESFSYTFSHIHSISTQSTFRLYTSIAKAYCYSVNNNYELFHKWVVRAFTQMYSFLNKKSAWLVNTFPIPSIILTNSRMSDLLLIQTFIFYYLCINLYLCSYNYLLD